MCKSDGAMPFSLSCQKVIYDSESAKNCIESPLNKTYMNYEFSVTFVNLKMMPLERVSVQKRSVQLPPRFRLTIRLCAHPSPSTLILFAPLALLTSTHLRFVGHEAQPQTHTQSPMVRWLIAVDVGGSGSSCALIAASSVDLCGPPELQTDLEHMYRYVQTDPRELQIVHGCNASLQVAIVVLVGASRVPVGRGCAMMIFGTFSQRISHGR